MKFMTARLKKIIIIGVGAIILVTISGVYLNVWTVKKMQKVILGLSSPNFPYRDYTEAELAKMYPQIKNVDVATRVTAEETYAKFRQALKENNLEMAIEQLSGDSRNYKKNKADLEKAYKEGRFKSILKSYLGEITKENMYEAIAQYYFNYEDNDENRTHFIDFIKNSDGDWKLDSL
jgi:isocitrate dehydrogenase kinase/phosphatase